MKKMHSSRAQFLFGTIVITVNQKMSGILYGAKVTSMHVSQSPYLRGIWERRPMNDGQVVLGIREVLENSPRSMNAADSSWHVEKAHHGLRGDVRQYRKVFGPLR